ncbi:MAG: hypothetical protein QOJ98_1076, partial [Acidobacteriota bacterium]|nr:hypothetical protein [Acidobacteriota bacterium]
MLTEGEGTLLASIRAANAVRLDAEIVTLAEKYGAEFTPQCIQPWEFLEATRFEALAPDRQKHVESCFSCALMFNHPPTLGFLAAEAAQEAAMWEPARLPRAEMIAAAAAAATEDAAPRRPFWQYLL